LRCFAPERLEGRADEQNPAAQRRNFAVFGGIRLKSRGQPLNLAKRLVELVKQARSLDRDAAAARAGQSVHRQALGKCSFKQIHRPVHFGPIAPVQSLLIGAKPLLLGSFIREGETMDSGISYIASGVGRDGDIDARAPILVTASSDAACNRGMRVAELAGFRTFAVPFEGAVERLLNQGKASAVWLELDDYDGVATDRLLDQVNADAAAGRTPAIVAAPARLIDPIAARLDAEGTQLLIDAGEAERIAALAVATGWRSRSAVNEDISNDPSSVRLRQLSDEVSRIAATLARLSSGVAPAGATAAERPSRKERGEPLPQVSGEQVRDVIRARRLRSRYFEGDLFADPAWDMLLDLLAAEIAQHRVPVSSLCIAAAVPATTALRWIKTMTDAGLFKRRADPHDGRRVFVELAPQASESMHRYFGEVGKLAAG